MRQNLRSVSRARCFSLETSCDTFIRSEARFHDKHR
jgi:hypothetical protein